jgi:S-adenosylmethionine:tRNA ribosyltransferase-isomerase
LTTNSFVDEGNNDSSAPAERALVRAGEGETRLFLRPGARFQVVDGMLTNFHLPRSTLLALVAAFVQDGAEKSGNFGSFDAQTSNGENGSNGKNNCCGLNRVQDAYREAVAERYRFFSFGDAMLIV